MESAKLILSTLLITGMIFSGCQKKEDLTDLNIELTEEEELPLPPTEEKDPILATANDFGILPENAKTAELKGYVTNILEFNKLLENIFVETFVQSEVTGLPGFRGEGAGTARTDCPDSSLSDQVNYPTTMTGENISMTAADGGVTNVSYIDSENILLYDDNGTNSGPLDVLDDTFTFFFGDMSVHCGNGTTLTVVAEEEIIYDLTCACIQDGTLNVFEGRDLFQNVNFGYPAEVGGEGLCDDEILVTTFVDERSSGEEVLSCPL